RYACSRGRAARSRQSIPLYDRLPGQRDALHDRRLPEGRRPRGPAAAMWPAGIALRWKLLVAARTDGHDPGRTGPMSEASPNPHLILPVGTQVVTSVEVKGADGKPIHPRGAVGVVVQAPSDYWHACRVRFPDGFEAALKRQEISVLAHFQGGPIGQPAGALA